MCRTKAFLPAVLGLVFTGLLLASAPQAFAKDDFGQIVKHIETQYHVHRQHRFLLGVAGLTVKFWHIGGVKNFKGAIFENQPFLNAGSDTRFDEVVRAAMNSGWQPLVQEFDRHSGERTYIYAQDMGRDLKVLAVVLESNEAVVVQAKIDANKLQEFIQDTDMARRHRDRKTPREDTNPGEDQTLEASNSPAPGWEGFCLFPDAETPELQAGNID
ncbi:MAG TPA: hypothetical protein VFT65_01565 [Candidatus Angelobacter sp.]|nr:hypothetical protein [Candidatus Angelobacter sp.]